MFENLSGKYINFCQFSWCFLVCFFFYVFLVCICKQTIYCHVTSTDRAQRQTDLSETPRTIPKSLEPRPWAWGTGANAAKFAVRVDSAIQVKQVQGYWNVRRCFQCLIMQRWSKTLCVYFVPPLCLSLNKRKKRSGNGTEFFSKWSVLGVFESRYTRESFTLHRAPSNLTGFPGFPELDRRYASRSGLGEDCLSHASHTKWVKTRKRTQNDRYSQESHRITHRRTYGDEYGRRQGGFHGVENDLQTHQTQT